MTRTLSRKERKRLAMKDQPVQVAPPPPQLQTIKPMTINQSKVFKEFERGQHLLVHGYAGTGKSFIGLYLALRAVEEQSHKKAVIVRSAVPSRDIGFLPGTDAEKAQVFELPYKPIVDQLYRRGGSYTRLKDAKSLEFTTTSFLRGLTIDDAVVVVDECQNMTDGEMNTVVTRMGKNSRLIICGDFRQNDLTMKRQDSCIGRLMETIDRMPSFSAIEMQPNDIVRSGLVKEWILARG